MSPSGTVLMCRKGTTLPFDVGNQRVIFYDFDGAVLDWEEVENTVNSLKLALRDASEKLDSPVYALLPHVMRCNGSEAGLRDSSSRARSESLVKYQKILAGTWLGGHVEIKTLLEKYMGDDFGLRAVGYYCLDRLDNPDVIGAATGVAEKLAKAAHYDLATEVYARLKAANKLEDNDLLKYASAYADFCPDIQHVNTAIDYVTEVIGGSPSSVGDRPPPTERILALGYHRLGSLLQKKWEQTDDKTDLEKAIDAYSKALAYMQCLRIRGAFELPGMIAHTRLKLLALRRKEGLDSRREDQEGHRTAILKIVERPDDDPASVSYLHWAKAIALADTDDTDGARAIMDDQLMKDAQLVSTSMEVSGRQYLTIRRFLDHYQDNLTNMGVISDRLRIVLRS
jgi:tetratricopeptide (TPR) repeat protein